MGRAVTYTYTYRGLIILFALGMVAVGCAGGGTALKKDPATGAKLVKVDINDAEDNTTVVVVADRPVTFTTVRIPDPPKVVMDLAGVDQAGLADMKDLHKGPVTYITSSRVSNARHVARLEIGLSSAVDSRIIQNGEAINIIFEKKKAELKPEVKKPIEAPPTPDPNKETLVNTPAAGQEAAPSKPARTVIVEKGPEAKAETPPKGAAVPKLAPAAEQAAEKPAPALPESTVVEKITCSREGSGYRVTIAGNGKFSGPKVFMLGKDRLVVDLPGVSSRKEKDTVQVGGACLSRVRMAGHKAENKVRVVLDLAGEAAYDVKGEGKALVITVGPAGTRTAARPGPAADAAPAAKAAALPEKPAAVRLAQSGDNVASGGPAPAAEGVKPAAARVASEGINVYISKEGKTVLSSAPIEGEEGMTKVEDKTKEYVETGTKIYTGGKISFDIQDADLDKVIKLLADVAGLNLIMDPADVRGKVTLKLNNVPWDQALDILLRIYNLDKVIEGNVLRVAPKAKLDDERRRDLLQIAEQKKLEQQAEDLYTKTFKANYTTAAELEPQIKKILSPRGDATANPRTNELIVTDVRDNLKKAEQLIAVLDKEVKQILIEARIVSVDVGYSQSLGISWGVQGADVAPSHSVGYALSSGPNSGQKFTEGDPSFKLTVPAEFALGGVGGVGTLLFGNIIKDVNIDLTIQALEAVNKGEVLAAPKLLTLENQAATITSGTTLYVQTTSAAGTRPEPLNANLSLTVTPRVTGDNFIMMDVTATNNSPASPPPGSTAAIDTKSVTTKVMVKDGDTIVLGGIYTKKNSKGDSHIPLLGRIPILGWLFKTQTWDDSTSELLIFITPKLVTQVGREI